MNRFLWLFTLSFSFASCFRFVLPHFRPAVSAAAGGIAKNVKNQRWATATKTSMAAARATFSLANGRPPGQSIARWTRQWRLRGRAWKEERDACCSSNVLEDLKCGRHETGRAFKCEGNILVQFGFQKWFQVFYSWSRRIAEYFSSNKRNRNR
jgi:hypothetical protein